MISALRKSKVLARYLLKPLVPLYKRLIKGNSIEGQTTLSRMVTGDSYFVVNIRTRQMKPIFQKEIDRDGHPSAIPGRDGWVITDTYPDLNSRARLLLGCIHDHNVVVLDELNSIPTFDNSSSRCDLHPKVSADGRFVSVDTMNDGVRSIYLYQLPDQIQ